MYWIRDYFGFSENETIGFIILGILMMFLLFLPFLYPLFLVSPSVSSKVDYQQMDSLLALIPSRKYTDFKKEEISSGKRYKNAPKKKFSPSKSKVLHLVTFDPNTVSKETLEQIGFSDYMIKNLIEYRKKGKTFRQKDEVKEVYGFPKSKYLEIAPYIQLPEKAKRKEKEGIKKRFPKKEIQLFDINRANVEILQQIKGIGKGYANRILNFRDKLGGFGDTSHIRDTYKLPPETATELLKYCYIGETPIKKININTVGLNQLHQHPYIRKYAVAQAIIEYRTKHGKIESMEDLMKNGVINDEILRKLAPYLTF